MTALFWLIPIALALGSIGLYAFFWSVKTGQFEDPKGDAERILLDVEDRPIFDEEDEKKSSKR
ncbi:MAG: cbb3-type cytochrome oxidase assembly protein CcoS [Robiginitomaculum sp.]